MTLTWNNFFTRALRPAVVVLAPIGTLTACSDDGVALDMTTGAVSGGGTSSDSNPDGDGGAATGGGDPAGTSITSGDASDDGEGETGAGAGSSGGTGGGDAMCTTPDDCVKVDDCCRCGAAPAGAEPPMCQIEECFATTCAVEQLEDVEPTCRLGVCELERVSCDPTQVTCDAPAPDCAGGYLPRVTASCWDGCVPASACETVPDCSWCDPETQVCVRHEGNTTSYVCEPRAHACDDTPDCACMGEVCGETESCVDDPEGLVCACTTCNSSQP